MEPTLQPTFIPKKTLSPQPFARPERPAVNFFSLISTVFFIAVLVLSGAVFGYEYYLNRNLEVKTQTLQDELNKFEPALVADLSRLDGRINNGSALLKNHVTMSALLTALGNMTLKNVRYTDFSYAASDKKTTLGLSGQAQSFSSVALQSVEYVKPENQKYLKDVIVSNLSLDPKGNVNFKVAATVDSKSLLYSVLSRQSGVTLEAVTSSSTNLRTTASTTASSSPARN